MRLVKSLYYLFLVGTILTGCMSSEERARKAAVRDAERRAAKEMEDRTLTYKITDRCILMGYSEGSNLKRCIRVKKNDYLAKLRNYKAENYDWNFCNRLLVLSAPSCGRGLGCGNVARAATQATKVCGPRPRPPSL